VKRLNPIIYILFIFSILGLTACDSGLGFSEQEEKIRYENSTFSRQDGACLGDPQVTEENQRCVSIKLQYPDIQSAPEPEMRKQLNQKIKALILSSDNEVQPQSIEQMAYLFMQDYKKETLEHPVNWNLEKVVEVILNTPQIISFSINESSYTGGAHGMYSQAFLNIDLDIMQSLALSDILLAGYEAELNVTGEKIFRQVKELNRNANLEKSGYWFERGFALNDNFLITEKGLLFYFNAYDIAPYALGATEILIPYSEIKNLIDPNGLLAALTHKGKN
jgi:hypothetical protein